MGQGKTTSRTDAKTPHRWWALALLVTIAGLGCGINKTRLATEQLVVSDAIDRAVATVDFSPLSGHKVFLDTQYLDKAQMGPTGNLGYVVSALRQQMVAYDCRMQSKAEDAEYIVEARVGVLANDGHELTYGVPGSAALSTASVLFSSPIPAPAMPELSLGRRNHHSGTAKLGVFAYDRVTGEPVWQAGLKKESSQARDMWVLGLGPFHQRPKKPRRSLAKLWKKEEVVKTEPDPLEAYNSAVVFRRAVDSSKKSAEEQGEVATASHSEAAEPERLDPSPEAKPAATAAAEKAPAGQSPKLAPIVPAPKTTPVPQGRVP